MEKRGQANPWSPLGISYAPPPAHNDPQLPAMINIDNNQQAAKAAAAKKEKPAGSGASAGPGGGAKGAPAGAAAPLQPIPQGQSLRNFLDQHPGLEQELAALPQGRSFLDMVNSHPGLEDEIPEGEAYTDGGVIGGLAPDQEDISSTWGWSANPGGYDGYNDDYFSTNQSNEFDNYGGYGGASFDDVFGSDYNSAGSQDFSQAEFDDVFGGDYESEFGFGDSGWDDFGW